MKRFIIPLVFALFVVACAGPLAAGARSESLAAVPVSPAEDLAPVEHLDCPICEFDMASYTGPLSEQEVHGLLLALNDEYHAWAVYDQVLQDHGDVRPFVNIKASEAKHIEALQELFVAYDLPVPANLWVDQAPSFESVKDACATGVEAEIANVDLYTELFASTERDDILRVYTSLQRASNENHLPAFERCARR